MTTIRVNGRDRALAEPATVADLVRELGHQPDRPGVAVAVDGEVLPRSRWADTSLRDGQTVEVLGAAQGG